MRRPRNVRFSSNHSYHVVNEDFINKNELFEYKSSSIRTGLEADEEKEYHFKNVMSGKSDNIYIPPMEEVVIKEFEKNFVLKEDFYEKEEDVTNEFFTNTEIINFSEKLEIEPEKLKAHIINRHLFNKLLKEIDPPKCKETVDYILNHTLNTEDTDETNVKLCYRNREIQTLKKGKKNDQFVLEKIQKFNTEIDILKKCCYEKILECQLEKEEIKNEREILYNLVEYFKKLKKKKRKQVLKDIYANNVLDSNIKIYQTVDSFDELISSPEKLAIVVKKLNDMKETNKSKKEKQRNFLKALFDQK